MIDIKPGDTVTFCGLNMLPDGSLRFGKHKKNRDKSKQVKFIVQESAQDGKGIIQANNLVETLRGE